MFNFSVCIQQSHYYNTIRIRQELKDMHKSSLLKANGISVYLPSDSNIHLLRVTMQAPRRCLYEGIIHFAIHNYRYNAL